MAAAVSAEEQRQIDEAIRVSKELWLAEAAEQRRRRSLAVSPVASASASGCIDLCSSSDEEDDAPVVFKTEPAKRSLERCQASEDDGCVVVPPPAKRPAAASAASAASAAAGAGDDDADVTIEGQSGAMALIDFPHARENCVQHAFVPGNFAATCANCYCFVCDAPASGCVQWAAHAPATHKEAAWRKERERMKQAKLARLAAAVPAAGAGGGMRAPPPAAAAAAAAAAAPAPAPVGAPAVDAPTSISCTELLKQVQQVWPVEEPTPVLLKAQLRPYQRQSLAFMLELERAPAGASTVGSVSTGSFPPKREVRGGWLCDEVGMGKTMACIATILANPLPQEQQTPWTIDPARDWHDHTRYGRSITVRTPTSGLLTRFRGNTLKLKTTLVLTKNTLIGQWKDEFEKFAPHLNVLIYHTASSTAGVRKKVDLGKVDLSKVDVILNTTQTQFPQWLVECATFHRVIIDESHEAIARQNNVLVSSYRWAVTGTPCHKSFTDLYSQLTFLGHNGGDIRQVVAECSRIQEGGPLTGMYFQKIVRPKFARLVALLQALMIRHTKAQRISGDVALKLPELEAETVWLTMSNAEKQKYTDARLMDSARWSLSIKDEGATVWAATMRMSGMMGFCSVADRKLRALVDDLTSLREKEPHMHAVVFTQSVAAHEQICSSVRGAGFTVYEISGCSDVKKRHRSIRAFQAAEATAKVFVLTMKTGNCGITLTAATRVYLMEPCIDPAHEQQAAGRIHRLGQHKDVLCKRFCFLDTYEQQVVELHTRLKNGTASLTDGRLSGTLFQLLTSK